MLSNYIQFVSFVRNSFCIVFVAMHFVFYVSFIWSVKLCCNFLSVAIGIEWMYRSLAKQHKQKLLQTRSVPWELVSTLSLFLWIVVAHCNLIMHLGVLRVKMHCKKASIVLYALCIVHSFRMFRCEINESTHKIMLYMRSNEHWLLVIKLQLSHCSCDSHCCR